MGFLLTRVRCKVAEMVLEEDMSIYQLIVLESPSPVDLEFGMHLQPSASSSSEKPFGTRLWRTGTFLPMRSYTLLRTEDALHCPRPRHDCNKDDHVVCFIDLSSPCKCVKLDTQFPEEAMSDIHLNPRDSPSIIFQLPRFNNTIAPTSFCFC